MMSSFFRRLKREFPTKRLSKCVGIPNFHFLNDYKKINLCNNLCCCRRDNNDVASCIHICINMIVIVIYGLWLRALHLLGKNRSLGDNVRIVDIESICKKVWTILGSQYSIQVCVGHNKSHRKRWRVRQGQKTVRRMRYISRESLNPVCCFD